MTRPSPARTRVVRRIAADPTSTALLLAGPTAVDLWPGIRRIAETGGRTLVETVVPPIAAATVRVLPLRRTPTSYILRFEWSGHGVPSTTGTLTLAYAPEPDGTLSTHAVLELDSAGLVDRAGPPGLQRQAEGFLDNLAQAAEQRASAA